ncbi:MAG: ABC transporter permease [Acidobacteriota bacterium]
MIHFILRRALETLILLFLLSLLTFAIFAMIPGDFLSEMELNPTVSKETVRQLREDYGLNDPFFVRYFKWLGQVLQGNLGYSFEQRRPAVDLILSRFQNTLALTIPAFVLTILLSVPLALFSALRAGSWKDRASLTLSLLGLSLPSILLSLLFLYFAFWSAWFPLGGTGGMRHLFLPALALALPAVAFWMRTLRLEMIDALGQPFVLAAAARGLPSRRILLHALRNAINPLISIMGITLGGLLSGAVVVEKVFQWPGLGSLTVDAILSRDLFVVVNSVLVAALFTVAANLAADLALAWNDPRIRYR